MPTLWQQNKHKQTQKNLPVLSRKKIFGRMKILRNGKYFITHSIGSKVTLPVFTSKLFMYANFSCTGFFPALLSAAALLSNFSSPAKNSVLRSYHLDCFPNNRPDASACVFHHNSLLPQCLKTILNQTFFKINQSIGFIRIIEVVMIFIITD